MRREGIGFYRLLRFLCGKIPDSDLINNGGKSYEDYY